MRAFDEADGCLTGPDQGYGGFTVVHRQLHDGGDESEALLLAAQRNQPERQQVFGDGLAGRDL
ncbi:hypothetical protein DAD186_13020 [Dermabacter vaginalis]|uniref:Uncharacterized protein n=1 Tax=Dermabacter vaginalis TaxID=1630135 RepID=A0A1B0ZJ51_9MICO|nr:hypothetical protein DAD186_13020 [Dermabacter vaginalis]